MNAADTSAHTAPERHPLSAGAANDEILVHTRGLTDEEVAAVVSVVRAGLEEELAMASAVDDTPERTARRWRQAIWPAPSARREWR